MASIEHLFDGLARLTLPLPMRPSHVHAYLLEGADGWTLVDTGLSLPESQEVFDQVARELRVARIVITHFHPDHVGAAQQAQTATGAPVYQGELDYEQCEHVWGSDTWPQVIADWFLRNGVPPDVANELLEVGSAYAPFIRYVRDPELLRPGDRVDGWEVVATPGHADGHLSLVRDGVLVAGDHLLPRITPAVGLYPDSRPDPLGDYLESLERIASLDLHLALPGHGEPMEDPSARARAIIEHHRERLGETTEALGAEPRTGYEVSYPLFGADLNPAARRFAVAETLSHLERLVRDGSAQRHDDGRAVSYTQS
ncbi:MAG TPA: MBL fold metallo-hydrolase [Gaiellaceae bacterium]|nr:MBL fold metallo-hydrolase [Gaiellaceae bacterium]